MADSPPVLIDDRLLIRELLAGLGEPDLHLSTTTYWYHRACRAAVAGAGGALSGPFTQLDPARQAAAIRSLLELRPDISLPDPRSTVPVMAELAERHPKLNVLNLEAAGAALSLGATVWLSPRAADGVLPGVLDAESVAWRIVDV
ncbi:MAG: hypothetical protein RIE08_13520 [Acidimicrobiales bacterium]